MTSGRIPVRGLRRAPGSRPEKPRLLKSRRKHNTIEMALETELNTVSLRMTSHVDVFVPDGDPRRIQLDKTEITIGRDYECNISIPLPSISRRHAQVTYTGDEYIIEDLDSTNGTFVNNIKVSRCVLRNNDQIRIGQAVLVFGQQKSAAQQ